MQVSRRKLDIFKQLKAPIMPVVSRITNHSRYNNGDSKDDEFEYNMTVSYDSDNDDNNSLSIESEDKITTAGLNDASEMEISLVRNDSLAKLSKKEKTSNDNNNDNDGVYEYEHNDAGYEFASEIIGTNDGTIP